MKIDLRDLTAKKNEVRLRETAAIELDFGPGAIVAGPLQADIKAAPADGVVEVDGNLELRMEFECGRCLTRYCQTLRFAFHELFTQNPAKENEEDEILLVPEGAVELQPYFEQAI